MVGGKKRISREEIFSKISSYDVFRMYMPWKFILNVNCRNPFTRKDNSPSMVIGDKTDNGEVIFKCFNSPHRGGCVEFVKELFCLNYSEALDKIANDFGLTISKSTKYKEIQGQYEQPKNVKRPSLLQAFSMPFREEHKKYLSSFYLEPSDLSFCKDTTCVALKEWRLNRLKMPLKQGEVAFAYNLENERGNWLKIYRPFADKKEKWKSSIPFTEMHGVGNIIDCKIGIVTKSLKDGAILAKYISPNIEIVQAEDYAAITEENKKRLLTSCQELYISFDSDEKGVESCKQLTKEMECKYINPPKYLLEKGVTDWGDMIKLLGPQAVIEFFKSKIKGL